MAAASEGRLNPLSDAAVTAAQAQVAPAATDRRAARVVVVAVIAAVECAWLVAVVYGLWRLVSLI